VWPHTPVPTPSMPQGRTRQAATVSRAHFIFFAHHFCPPATHQAAARRGTTCDGDATSGLPRGCDTIGGSAPRRHMRRQRQDYPVHLCVHTVPCVKNIPSNPSSGESLRALPSVSNHRAVESFLRFAGQLITQMIPLLMMSHRRIPRAR
jgi:hypothetical protein